MSRALAVAHVAIAILLMPLMLFPIALAPIMLIGPAADGVMMRPWTTNNS